VEGRDELLKGLIERELANRIEKQVKEEQYLAFYNIVAEEPQVGLSGSCVVPLERRVQRDY
jgi:glutaredoxin-related protein